MCIAVTSSCCHITRGATGTTVQLVRATHSLQQPTTSAEFYKINYQHSHVPPMSVRLTKYIMCVFTYTLLNLKNGHISTLTLSSSFVTAMTLLVGHQEEHLACKN